MNMLRKQHTPQSVNYFAQDVSESSYNREDIPTWKEEERGTPAIGELLSSSERRELGELLDKFNGIVQTHPGQTELTEHQIEDQRYDYHHIGSPKRTERKCDRRSRTCWKMGS